MEAVTAICQKVRPDPLPDRPWALDYLWDYFWELSDTRQIGMEINPITFTEIKSFSEITGAGLDPWETRLIRRMDVAAMDAWRAQKPRPLSGDPKSGDTPMIPATNVKGIGSLLRGLAVKKEVQAQRGELNTAARKGGHRG